MNTTHQQIRQQLWTTVAGNLASMAGVNDKTTSVAWADAMLEAFDKRFADTEDVVKQLREDFETERMRLAAVGVVAMADTPESAAKAREMHPDYESASLHDVIRRVDECMELREKIKELEEWKRQQLEVSRRWDLVDNHVRNHASTVAGRWVWDETLRLLDERDQYLQTLKDHGITTP